MTVEHFVIVGVSALVFFNLTRIVAVKLGKQPGPLGAVGKSIGALVTFSAS
jgi:hypothetical protein